MVFIRGAPDPSEHSPPLFAFQERLITTTRRATSADSDTICLLMSEFVIAQAADRIADHATIIGARLRYLITGGPAHLAAELR